MRVESRDGVHIVYTDDGGLRGIFYTMENARLFAAAGKMREALLEVEWIDDHKPTLFCPWCFSVKDTGHSKSCQLAAALADAGEGEE